MRPKGHLTITLLLALFTLSQLLWFGSYDGDLWWEIFFMALFVGAGLAITVFFWCGFNWARVVVQVGHFVIGAALFDYLRSDTQQPLTPVQWNVWVAQTVFGVFLFYWLNTRRVRDYFIQRKTRHADSQADFDTNAPPIPEPYGRPKPTRRT